MENQSSEQPTNIEQLFENNRAWADAMTDADPSFFERLAKQQAPEYLWIGCADSRVPSTQLVNLLPGEMFVHRNVANLVVHSDLNCLSVLHYAVEVLKVRHIIVCGHYGCGGVQAALQNLSFGLIDNWLRHVQDVQHKHRAAIKRCTSTDQQIDLLCELNAIEQATNICQTTIVQKAWGRGQNITVHAWVYGLKDGILHDLDMRVSSREALDGQYERAIQRVCERA